jgi:hypothetical protein
MQKSNRRGLHSFLDNSSMSQGLTANQSSNQATANNHDESDIMIEGEESSNESITLNDPNGRK